MSRFFSLQFQLVNSLRYFSHLKTFNIVADELGHKMKIDVISNAPIMVEFSNRNQSDANHYDYLNLMISQEAATLGKPGATKEIAVPPYYVNIDKSNDS